MSRFPTMMKTFRGGVHIAALLGLLAALWGCGGRTSSAGFGGWQPTLRATPEIASLEQQMATLVNRDRARAGLLPLRFDERLADIARAHSLDMVQARFFSHTSPSTGELEDRMDRAGYLAWEMRENLAVAESLERAEVNLMNSPGHAANLLAPKVTHLGVGIVRGNHRGDLGGFTVTQVFARPAQPQTPAQASAQLLQRFDQQRRSRGLAPLARLGSLDGMCQQGLSELSDEVPQNEVNALATRLGAQLDASGQDKLAALYVYGQHVLSADEVPLPPALARPRVHYAAVASAPSRDRRGRPRLKVLVLLAERR